MKKTYCDICEAQITKDNEPEALLREMPAKGPRGYSPFKFVTAPSVLRTKREAYSREEVTDRVDYCVHCFIDAVNHLDKRAGVLPEPSLAQFTDDQLMQEVRRRS